MNKVILVVVAVLVLGFLLAFTVNQGKFHRAVADRLGSSEICVDGVRYLQFPSGATVKYNKNGTIATCN